MQRQQLACPLTSKGINNNLSLFISTDKKFNATDLNVYLTRVGSVWPRLPALAWPLLRLSRYLLPLPNSLTKHVNADQTFQQPASMTKNKKRKQRVTARKAIAKPRLAKPAPILVAVPTTTTKIRRTTNTTPMITTIVKVK
jgi:hypothetical protein